ncbi:hypothetical protein KI387_012870, partial [Taxus chinensis]
MVVVMFQVVIVLLVIFSGAFEIDVSNWTPFAPNGVQAIVTGATVVFFAYVGFDAVANSAEECRKPKEYTQPPGFSCPGAPLLPAFSIFFNIFLFAQ